MSIQFATYIDHTLLKPDATKDQITTLVKEADTYKFASVCVNPYWVSFCADQLKDSSVKVCTVIGFPLGASATEIKAFETKQAIADGADEVDMVINIGALKSGMDDVVRQDIEAVVKATTGEALVKVIIETSLLTEDEKRRACELAVAAGADFVKTSTGFSGGGATVADVKLMREVVGKDIGVKASGGVRNQQDAIAVIEAGANRIGASAGIAIIEGDSAHTDY
ncbi:deoxyribose-phosphate aldolase [Ornithinibacillus gellani]|uniref:deoxyribose-phosphate aldolase n=1 Tax=Ornithinibacillus gellani TaxID=2293253 RepID=UPI000F46DCE3|nr:deoxyribose-phosphate aldolase [Ornithinibacillus gellani]TQS74584.1 deoxyribose-phosphate aldolase [Ornithinibacillus gellani]